jgi:hypothetical protein
MVGIIAAVKGGRVGNSAFDRKLHGHRGGKARVRWGLRPWGARLQRRSARKRRPGRTPNSTGSGTRCPDWEKAWGPCPGPRRPVYIGLRSDRRKTGASGTTRRERSHVLPRREQRG